MFNEDILLIPLIVLLLYIPNIILRVFLICTVTFFAVIRKIIYYIRLPPVPGFHRFNLKFKNVIGAQLAPLFCRALYWSKYLRNSGPWGIPLLGYLPFMSNKPPHKLYMDMCKRYGDVFSVSLGSNLVVGLGSYKLMRDYFNRPDSAGRPHTPLNSLLSGLGIVTSEGLLWKRTRRFLHEKFRALGVKLSPNQQFEKYILAELEEMISILHETIGKPVYPYLIFGRHVHNVICQLLMNFRFERHDLEFTNFNEKITRGMKLFGMVHMGEHFKPYLHLPGKQAVLKEIKTNLEDVSKFHEEHLEKRVMERKISSVNTEPADLLDCYLECKNKEQICPGVKPDKQFIQIMNDLFSAGMDTTLSTFLWTLVMMLREPEAAANVRKELAKSVAPGQLITMEHRLSMPYIEAFIFETMRIVSVVPLGTVHVNETDWNIEGYTIPAGTHIVPLINKMNMNPELYPEPEKFKPERFIVNGKCHAVNFLQFGVGQRMCLGNMLARMELFLFFANIMNTFEFALPEGEPVPDLEGVLGVIHAPLPYMLSFKKLE